MLTTERVLSSLEPWESRILGSRARAIGVPVIAFALAFTLVARTSRSNHASRHSLDSGHEWLAATAAGALLVGGLSLLWLTLARFAREVERAPYAWLAPMIATLPCLAIFATNLTPPGGVPGMVFAIVWIPLVIGGGSLFRQADSAHKALGSALWATPAVWCSVSAAIEGDGNVMDGWHSLQSNEQAFLVVVAATCCAIGGLAFLTRDRRQDAYDLWQEERKLAQERLSIAEERATLTEERESLDALVARAEAALGGGAVLRSADVTATPRARKRRWLPLVLATPVIAAGVLIFEFGHRRPMLAQAAEIRALKDAHEQEPAKQRQRPVMQVTSALTAPKAQRNRAVAEHSAMSAKLDTLRRARSEKP